MPTPFIAYVPYAAAAYCIAKVGQQVWPALQSQLASATRFSTVHGMDGADPVAARVASDCPCPPTMYGQAFNTENPYVRNAPPYCYNLDTLRIEGDGPLDGRQPPETTVALWSDEDGTQLASINISGDSTITIPVCVTSTRIPTGGRKVIDWERPTRVPPQPCYGRTVPMLQTPTFTRASCGRW